MSHKASKSVPLLKAATHGPHENKLVIIISVIRLRGSAHRPRLNFVFQPHDVWSKAGENTNGTAIFYFIL